MEGVKIVLPFLTGTELEVKNILLLEMGGDVHCRGISVIEREDDSWITKPAMRSPNKT